MPYNPEMDKIWDAVREKFNPDCRKDNQMHRKIVQDMMRMFPGKTPMDSLIRFKKWNRGG